MDIYDRAAAEATDISRRIAAQAAVYVMEHRDIVDTAIKYVSWAITLNPFIKLAFEQFDITGVLEHGRDVVDEGLLGPAGEYLDQERAAQEAERVNELIEAPDRSVEIAGSEVEAQIAEIKKLQAEHEVAKQELSKQFEDEQQKQSVIEEKIQKDYFEAHPDQTDAERQRDEQKFDGAKQHNREDLMAKQEARMAELLQGQQEQLQQLQGDQQSQAQKDWQVRQEFRQNEDDMFR